MLEVLSSTFLIAKAKENQYERKGNIRLSSKAMNLIRLLVNS